MVIDRAPKGTDLGLLLGRGDIDAVFMPHPPPSIMKGDVPTRRLFKDSRAEEQRYFKKYGWWPIMHIVAMHPDLATRHPSLPQALMDMFHQAHEINLDYYTDPNWSRLPWIRYLYEDSAAAFGDPWNNGFQRNRANLEKFVLYSHDQGLIKEKYNPERFFVPSTLNT